MSHTPFLLDPYVRAVILATALGFMVLEYALGRLAHRPSHDWRESAASLGVAVGQNLVRGLEAGILAIPFAYLYQHRLFDFDQTNLPALAGLFIGSEFLYYWQHRASHRVRWMWARAPASRWKTAIAPRASSTCATSTRTWTRRPPPRRARRSTGFRARPCLARTP